MIILYDHQREVIEKTRNSLRKNKRVLMQLPTGGGKTVIAAFIAQSATVPVWFICHRRELIYQTSMTFSSMGIRHGIISAGYAMDIGAKVQICAVDTLRNRIGKISAKPGLVIWDEAHHLPAKTWSTIMDALYPSIQIGLSATPERTDGRGLGDHFDDMVIGPNTGWLIDNGFLSQYRYFAPSEPDTSGLHTKAGDYDNSESAALMSKSKIVGDVVRHYQVYARNTRAIGFAVNIDHSQMLVSHMKANGIRAAHLDGSTHKDIRRKTCIDLADGNLDVIWNVGLFGEGFDLSAQAGRDVTIETVIQARPTQSAALFLQIVGRALRKKDYPAIILDHAGNYHRHGMPDDNREWSLDSGKRSRKKSENDVSIKTCPKCFAVLTKNAQKCTICGHPFSELGPEPIMHQDGELAEIMANRMHRKKEQGKAKSIDDLIALGVQRGYKNPVAWASHVYTARMQNRERN